MCQTCLRVCNIENLVIRANVEHAINARDKWDWREMMPGEKKWTTDFAARQIRLSVQLPTLLKSSFRTFLNGVYFLIGLQQVN